MTDFWTNLQTNTSNCSFLLGTYVQKMTDFWTYSLKDVHICKRSCKALPDHDVDRFWTFGSKDAKLQISTFQIAYEGIFDPYLL